MTDFFTVRPATTADVPALERLIELSVRGLNQDLYTQQQVESALVHVFGVDTQLIVDGTYYVAEANGQIVASGGWSRRRTLFGGDQHKSGNDDLLDSARDAARIRAFFVHPSWARRGLARRLYEECETRASAEGFRAFELGATLPGQALYRALGFAAQQSIDVRMPDGVTLPLVRMRRSIEPSHVAARAIARTAAVRFGSTGSALATTSPVDDGYGPPPAIRHDTGPPTIPGYTIEREIGRGGAAVVYLAREEKHGRMIALKVLHSELSLSLQAERFLREIDIISRLAHPNILPLLDSGRAGNHLYYAMPYVAGESLRGRLERERQLPIADAVRIAREVAVALDYAHRQGIIHRDVKPENILMADGHPLVADFGVARALSVAGHRRITLSGLALGTPRYMSPEQAAGDPDVDARSDIYSLGCVLYELIAGGPPFNGITPQQIVAQHLAAPVPSLSIIRQTVSRDLEQAVRTALEKSPVDRFATAAAFANALGPRSIERRTWEGAKVVMQRPTRPLIVGSLIGAAAMVVGIGLFAARDGAASERSGRVARVLQRIGLMDVPLDTMTYVVEPTDSAEAVAASFDVSGRLGGALTRWHELTVVEPATVISASREAGAGAMPDARTRATAMRLGAGRFIRTKVARLGDSVDVSATLFDTRSGARRAEARVRLVRAGGPDSAIAQLADGLLFAGDAPRSRRVGGSGGTVSLSAHRAFLRGHSALEAGAFARADSEFYAATRIDPDYPEALVWLAHVRTWLNSRDRPWAQLTQQAAQAVSRRGRLAPSDSVLLEALRALADGRGDVACSMFGELTRRERFDYAAWYGYGNCLRRDSTVVRDAAGQWQFRTSYEEALRAYERAFRLRPSVLSGFGGRALTNLKFLMFTSSARIRPGLSAAPGAQVFVGIPRWNDSLAFTPFPREQSWLVPWPDAVFTAIQRQRDRFHAIARMWRAEVPDSPAAAEAVAVALEMLGNAAALDTIRVARSLAIDPDDRLRIAASEVLLRVKFSVPADLPGLSAARALADSLLDAHRPSEHREAQILGSLAALTGRAKLAAAYASAGGAGAVAPGLAESAPQLLAFAALGGPSDTLAVLEQRVESDLRGMPEAARNTERITWLMRAAALAFPDHRFQALPAAGATVARDASLVAAAAAGDTAAVHRMLAAVADARRNFRPADLMVDGLLPEASALFYVGDVQRAIAWLDPTLRSLRLSTSQDLGYIVRSASLVRAMALRAELARRAGDSTTARAWAKAVVTLWSGADAFLQPTVRKLETLAR